MKKVIFHLDDSKNLRGGERQVLCLVRELEKAGCRNFIVCRKNSPLENAAQELRLESFDLPYYFEWDPFSAIALAIEIKVRMKSFDIYDIPIVHSHTAHTAATAYMACKLVKAVRIAHRRTNFHISSISARLKYAEADAVISISKAINRSLLVSNVPPEKINLIPSSTNLDDFQDWTTKDARADLLKKTNMPADSILIGSLMELGVDKDPLNLIRAAQKVVSAEPKCHFLVGGDGPLMQDVSNEIKKLGIGNNFHLLGYCRENIKFLKGLDIFVLSSREEGLGSSLIEAMAAGLPLVGTDAGGIPELITPDFNGLLVQKENPGALGEALLRLARNTELRKKFSANSLSRSLEYSSTKMAQMTLLVYEKALKNFKFD